MFLVTRLMSPAPSNIWLVVWKGATPAPFLEALRAATQKKSKRLKKRRWVTPCCSGWPNSATYALSSLGTTRGEKRCWRCSEKNAIIYTSPYVAWLTGGPEAGRGDAPTPGLGGAPKAPGVPGGPTPESEDEDLVADPGRTPVPHSLFTAFPLRRCDSHRVTRWISFTATERRRSRGEGDQKRRQKATARAGGLAVWARGKNSSGVAQWSPLEDPLLQSPNFLFFSPVISVIQEAQEKSQCQPISQEVP